MFRALYSYEPDKDYIPPDIHLRVNDIITNVEYMDNGWALGFNASTRKAGVFPRRYVQSVDDEVISLPFSPPKPKERPLFANERVEDYFSSEEIWSVVNELNLVTLKEAIKKVVFQKRRAARSAGYIFWFIFGVILGVLTFLGCMYALEYPPIPAGVIAGLSCIVVVTGVVFSTRCRAVVVLCLPTLSTRTGRFLFSTIAVAVLLRGPISNIKNNTAELAGTSSCSVELLSNQTEIIQKLASEPLRRLADGVKQTVNDLKSVTEEIDALVRPVVDIANDAREQITEITAALVRARNSCVNKLDSTKLGCEGKIADARNACREGLSEARLSLCGAFSSNCEESNTDTAACDLLNNDMCEALSTVRTTCDVSSLGVDQSLVDKLQTQFKRLEQYLYTNITLKDILTAAQNSSKNGTTIGRAVLNELDENTAVIQLIFSIANKFLALSIVLVVYQAFKYLRLYLKDDKFDNFYITPQFIEIDEVRATKGKTSLLPLKPSEMKKMIDTRQCKLAPQERKSICSGLFAALLNIIGGAAIITFDFLLTDAIKLINKHSTGLKVEIKSEADVGLQVNENGFLGKFLNDVFGNLRTESKFNHIVDFSVCLPVVTDPEYQYIITLGVVYMLLICSLLCQAYVLRLRNRIANFYYPERQRMRVTFLYRKLLRNRVIMLKEIKDVIKFRRAQLEHEEIGKDFLDDLRSSCGCFDVREKCMICSDKETPTDENSFCPQCNSYYCAGCFETVLNQRCPCDPSVPLAYDNVNDSDFEQDLQEEIAEEYSYAKDVQETLMAGQAEREEIYEMRNHNNRQRHRRRQFDRRSDLNWS